jgi:hypothetical protein
MRVDWAIPCRAARVEGPLMNIVGAHVDTLYARNFPARLSTGLAIRLVFGDVESDGDHELALRLLGPELEPLGQLGHPLCLAGMANPQKSPGWEGSHLIATVIRFEATRPGLYSVEVLVNGRHQRTLPFSVRPLEQYGA